MVPFLEWPGEGFCTLEVKHDVSIWTSSKEDVSCLEYKIRPNGGAKLPQNTKKRESLYQLKEQKPYK